MYEVGSNPELIKLMVSSKLPVLIKPVWVFFLFSFLSLAMKES